MNTIKIYTDGSCHTQLLIGAWAAIIFINDKKIILKGIVKNTTHNRMELLGIINAIDYLITNDYRNNLITICSDSQYAVNLTGRKEKLKANNFITKKGTPIQNVDLVKRFILLIESNNLEFVKIKAHQKNGDVINREVDILVRNILRKKVTENE